MAGTPCRVMLTGSSNSRSSFFDEQRKGHSFTALLTLIVILLAGFATPARAQQVFGSIFGTITDPTGSAVANATVTITDVNKGTASTTTTNESGNYQKGQLIPGVYTVTVENAGFQKVLSTPITVQVDQASKFDASLTVGSVSSEIEVTAAAPLLQADRADVAQTLSTKEINELPSIGRNLQAYELLNPGTVRLGWAHASDENPQGSVQMETNGQLFSAMGYELDGTTNQDPILGIIVINPTFDSTNEVKQANQNFDAEFEYVGGGIASYSTKSGTNSLHGDAFEYLQVNTPGFEDFARNPFTNANPVYRENQFGGSIGGKVIKDKLFFFGDAQLIREAQGGSVLTSVPTAADRTGNLGDWLAQSANYQIYDPTTGNQTTGIGRTPFPGNVIPASRLSPQALAILDYFPLPNINTSQPYNNFAGSGDISIISNQWDTRWDYYLNQKSSIFGRYSYAQYGEFGPGAFGLEAGGPTFVNYAGNSQALNQSIALGWTYTASPTLVNELRFGYMRYHVFDVPNGYGTTPAADAGIPGLNLDKTYTSGMPYFNIENPIGSDQLGYALGVNQCNCPLTQTERQYQVVDNLHKTYGNHSFKFGADIRYAENLRVPSDTHRAGELTFSGALVGDTTTEGGSTSTGVGLASFLLGDVSGFGRYVSSSTDAEERQKRWFFYGQDEWRVTPKLTFTYGFRWEMIFPETVNATGNGATFDPATGMMYVFGEAGVSTHGIQSMNWHNLVPRIGLAYQLNPKTVVRAGYGWSYDLGTFGSTFGHNVTQNPPVLLYQNPSQPNGSAFLPIFNLAAGPPAPPTVTVGPDGSFPLPAGVTPKYRPDTVTLPTVYQYNVSLQRQVAQKISVTASYVGNVDRHNFLGTSQNINPNEAVFVPGVTDTLLDEPYYQKFGISQGLQYYCNCSNEMYNSLQAQVHVSNLRGYDVQGSYTYQRQFGDGWGYDSNYLFLYDRAAGQGYNGNLPRNQITIAQTYAIPFGRGRQYGANLNRGVDYVLGGWTISGITQFYSGLGINPTLESYSGQPNVGSGGRPDIGSGGTAAAYQGAQGNRNQWLIDNPAAFSTPGTNAFGNYPINVLFGPHYIQQDLSLQKTFQLNERIGLQFRGDSTNVLNHTNLATPNSDVNSPNFGQITSLAFGGLNGMRRLQFSATVRF